jgi:pantoate--beta-alanine ligase
MTVIEDIGQMQAHRGAAPTVLVPTMGALHVGHAELVRHGRELAGADGSLVVSIFVNPTQFGPGEDFEAYPLAFADDCSLCKAAGADVVFHPSAETIYRGEASTTVAVESLTDTLCGSSRPGHFIGVCTVVAKLFNIVRPNIAVFGKKDYQQLAVLQRMGRDLNFAIEILGAETVRETDGLAMSSRNRYLSQAERQQAPAIRRALLAMAESTNAEASARIALGKKSIEHDAPLGRIDYLEIVDRETMAKIDTIDRPALAAAAVFFGQARLIDNIEIMP